jgi:hypothetical protein
VEAPLVAAPRKDPLLQDRHPDCHYIKASLRSLVCPAINLMLEDPRLEMECFRLKSVSASHGPQFARWLEACCQKVGSSVRIRVERCNN